MSPADNNSKSLASPEKAWRAYTGTVTFASRVVEVASQIVFMWHQQSGGVLFTLLALAQPILNTQMVRDWMKGEHSK